MNHQKAKHKRQLRRRHHVRRKITGTPERPRLTRLPQLQAHLRPADRRPDRRHAGRGQQPVAGRPQGPCPTAATSRRRRSVGQKLAEAAKAKGIDKAAFDRGHYRYHGRIKALAEAANAAGLQCCEPKERKKAKMAAEAAAAAAKPEKAEKASKEKKEKKEKKEARRRNKGR